MPENCWQRLVKDPTVVQDQGDVAQTQAVAGHNRHQEQVTGFNGHKGVGQDQEAVKEVEEKQQRTQTPLVGGKLADHCLDAGQL